jgi:hypothetical protein
MRGAGDAGVERTDHAAHGTLQLQADPLGADGALGHDAQRPLDGRHRESRLPYPVYPCLIYSIV